MKEIVKEVKYTGILSLVLLISVFMIWGGIPSLSYSITKEKLSEVTDSKVKDIVTNKINHLNDFRKANINNNTILIPNCGIVKSNRDIRAFCIHKINEGLRVQQ